MDTIRLPLRDYILTQLLSGEDPARLHDDDPLIESGVLDSLALVHLIGFIEERFAITVPPGLITEEHFGSISQLTRFLSSRLALTDAARGSSQAPSQGGSRA